MVGIVIVSHSNRLAEGVKELADSLTGGRVPIATAGGLNENTLGTSVDRIMSAILSAWQGDGVLVLVDLGSSVLNTRLALELLPEAVSQKTILSTAPLVEGALVAALRVDTGGDLSQVLEAVSRAGSFPKGEDSSPSVPDIQTQAQDVRAEGVVTILNPDGIHARSAARLVEEVRKSGAAVTISKAGSHRAPVRADSLFNLLALSGKPGDQLLVSVEGENAQAALTSIQDLFASGFGENDPTP